MQSAYLYIRVSTDEQATKGYSLRYQKDALLRYCQSNNIQVHKIFSEDCSAKTFNRPEWREMISELQQIRKESRPEQILFTKWDRFSRNIGNAYVMLEKLNRLGVEAHAIEQPLDARMPENRVMLAIYLATSEAENERRSINVRQGMKRAKEEGRWMGHASIGYRNSINQDGKKVIVPNLPESEIIKFVFEELDIGNKSISILYKEAKASGLNCSLSSFWRLIQNPVYCGRITVSRTKHQKAEFVIGQHEKLISPALFDRVQERLHSKGKPQIKTRDNEFLPLRGFLGCPFCRRTLTGSASMGRNKKYYYYHCRNGCKYRIRAEIANKLFSTEVKKLVPDKHYIDLYIDILQSRHRERFGACAVSQLEINKSIERLFDRAIKARELLYTGEIDIDDYRVIKADCEKRISAAGFTLQDAATKAIAIDKNLHDAVNKFVNPGEIYENANVELKRKIIRILTGHRTIFIRNGKVNPFLTDPALIVYGKLINASNSDSPNRFVPLISENDAFRIDGISPIEQQNRHKMMDTAADEVSNFLIEFVDIVLLILQ